MNKEDNINRLDAIIEGASKLSTEKQELILAGREGMAFTKKLYTLQGDRRGTEKKVNTRSA